IWMIFLSALLEIALLLWLGSRVLAVCPSMCSCSRSHRELPADLPRSLWQIYAASNRILVLDKNDTLERATFINNTLIKLCTLNLSHNHFWTLPTNLPINLETIDLLTHFYLHANRFSSLPFGVLDKTTSLRVITLGDNPWACHLYADTAYLVSWTQHTSARVLGCPCHTQPVCGGVRPGRTGGWHFASYNLPPLAASAQDLSSPPPEDSVTGWWYFSVSALLSTPHTPKETLNTPTLTSRSTGTNLTINHLSATAADIDRMWHTDSYLVSDTKGTSPTDSFHATDTSLFVVFLKVFLSCCCTVGQGDIAMGRGWSATRFPRRTMHCN
uniref:Oligodendrocyte myelin glycoprotein a n=1 Tax=Stegastes partitus TaxID=144197 RepID=A0A3B5BCP1_9TELE